jgi:hypothetical protein
MSVKNPRKDNLETAEQTNQLKITQPLLQPTPPPLTEKPPKSTISRLNRRSILSLDTT